MGSSIDSMNLIVFTVLFVVCLVALHLILASPGLWLLWKLRSRTDARTAGIHILATAVAGFWTAPTLLGGHFPLLLPLPLTYLASVYSGL
jgi:hypothetical protein